MADTMTALLERHRAYKMALSTACGGEDWSREAEEKFYETADTEAGDQIEGDPPALLNHTDLISAISYIAEDVDFLQEGHGRVAARALEYLRQIEADRKPPAIEDLAMIEFKPWEGEPESQKQEAWLSWLRTLNFCIVTMHRTKPELTAMFRDQPEAAMELRERMETLGHFLGDMHGLARGASQRLLIAASVVASEPQGATPETVVREEA